MVATHRKTKTAERRSRMLRIRMAEDEIAKLQAKADREQLPLGTWARATLLKAAAASVFLVLPLAISADPGTDRVRAYCVDRVLAPNAAALASAGGDSAAFAARAEDSLRVAVQMGRMTAAQRYGAQGLLASLIEEGARLDQRASTGIGLGSLLSAWGARCAMLAAPLNREALRSGFLATCRALAVATCEADADAALAAASDRDAAWRDEQVEKLRQRVADTLRDIARGVGVGRG